MQQIADWLAKIGLERYAPAFADNDIDVSVLPHLTDADLEKIGVSLGHPRKMLAAIAETASPAQGSPQSTPTGSKLQDTAERRQVTVMFSDLVGSTALSARMDPEDLREVISAYQKCVAETVRRFGGFVAKYMGDGVLVYFGYPQAHEHDAERAVRAGLELITAVVAVTTRASLQTRVGIATGLVVIGDLVGSGESQERRIVGDTPNLAARLQAAAAPGTIVIGPTTRQLLAGLFEYRDLGEIEVKGFATPARAYQVLQPSTVESRFEAMRTATTPLVGRREEIDLLTRRWEQAKAGDGCVVLIAGEPGIGKSRIAQTMVEGLAAEAHTRLRYFCSPHHQDSALYPAITQLERAAGFRRDDTADQRLDKLEAVLSQGTNDLREAVPLIADLFSIPTGDRYPALDLTPQKRKEKTLAALVAQVEGLSAREPVLMVFEDVHWSDPTTRESLDLLIDRVSTLRVLVIITFRPEFTPLWIGRPHVTLLSLNRLPPRQRAEMIASVTGGKALPKEIADQIIDRTDGVPLFIEELTKSVVESGLVTEAGDRYAVTGPAAPLAIPTTLHASLLARLDRLAPTREVAQIGAALGRSFSHELISAVTQMPQDKLNDALDQLVRAELIFRRGMPPDAEYTFKHALVQDAAYGTLLRSRRQQIHARIATMLEGQFPELVSAQPALMAQHCAEAGLAEKAISYRLKAGQQAVARSAMIEAVSQLQKGLDSLPNLPDDPIRQQQELDLQAALAPALMATRNYSAPEIGDTIARARALAEQLDRPDYLIGLLFGQCWYHFIRAEHHLAHSVAKEMEQIGETRNDRAALLLGHYLDAFVRYALGEWPASCALFEQCDGLSDPAYRAVYAALAPEDPYATKLVFLGMTLAHMGYLDRAQHCVASALAEARRLEHAYTLCFVLSVGTWAQWPARSAETAQRQLQELMPLANEQGFPLFMGWGTIHDGWSSALLGRAGEGLALLTKGFATIRATAELHCVPWLLVMLAEVHLKLGQTAEGHDSLAEAAQIIERTDERFVEAELHRLRGELLNTTGDQAAAEEKYHQALAVAQRQSAKTLELRAAISLARLWIDQGKRSEARDLLASVYVWFTEGFDTPVLQEAKALLDQVAGAEHGPPLARSGQAE